MTINTVQAGSKADFLEAFAEKFISDPQRAMKAKLAVEGIFAGIAELAALGHEVHVADVTGTGEPIPYPAPPPDHPPPLFIPETHSEAPDQTESVIRDAAGEPV